jgi:hypothetical protein
VKDFVACGYDAKTDPMGAAAVSRVELREEKLHHVYNQTQ